MIIFDKKKLETRRMLPGGGSLTKRFVAKEIYEYECLKYEKLFFCEKTQKHLT